MFRSAEAFEAASDASALTFAQQFTRHGKVEVWQLGRKIAVLEPEQSPPEFLTRQ